MHFRLQLAGNTDRQRLPGVLAFGGQNRFLQASRHGFGQEPAGIRLARSIRQMVNPGQISTELFEQRGLAEAAPAIQYVEPAFWLLERLPQGAQLLGPVDELIHIYIIIL